jgi:hypothetical protein
MEEWTKVKVIQQLNKIESIMVPFVKTNFGTIIMCHYLPYMYHIFFYAAVSKLSPKTSAGVLYPNASCGL